MRAAGVASPEYDARALLGHVLGLSKPSQLAMVETVTETDGRFYDALIARRARREPLQHLTGSVGFRWIELAVGPGVFVPRPETESVVQWALDALAGIANPVLVDLCAGSGAIALSLAHEVPGATVHAVERDPAALLWARRNAATRVAAGDPEIMLHLGSLQDALPELDGTVDLVASNPPYIPLPDRDLLDPEVLDYDPALALFGGEDGLDVIRLVEQAARRLLKPGGRLVVEHSDQQGGSAPALFGEGWTDVQDHQDLTGRNRFVTARKDVR